MQSPDCRPHGPLSGAAKHPAGARPSKCVVIFPWRHSDHTCHAFTSIRSSSNFQSSSKRRCGCFPRESGDMPPIRISTIQWKSPTNIKHEPLKPPYPAKGRSNMEMPIGSWQLRSSLIHFVWPRVSRVLAMSNAQGRGSTRRFAYGYL
jgi:hypothetical protein